MTAVPRILIVDDHQLAREGLKAVLDGNHAEVVGMASTGEESVAKGSTGSKRPVALQHSACPPG